jgi:hypothetical protein
MNKLMKKWEPSTAILTQDGVEDLMIRRLMSLIVALFLVSAVGMALATLQ